MFITVIILVLLVAFFQQWLEIIDWAKSKVADRFPIAFVLFRSDHDKA